MLVIVTRQTLLDDLLLDAHQRGNEVLSNGGIILAHIVQKDHACSHHRRIRVAQHLADLVVQVADAALIQLVETVKSQKRSLANELTLVGQQACNRSNHSGNHFRRNQHRRGNQRIGNLGVVVRRHILLITPQWKEHLLKHVDHHETELMLRTNARSSRQVSDLLQVHVLAGGQLPSTPTLLSYLDALNITEGAIVSEHLAVDHTEHVLLNLTLPISHIVLSYVRTLGVHDGSLQLTHLLDDDSVLVLLRFAVSNGIHKLSELSRRVAGNRHVVCCF